jgi:voltage-gated potassium channel
VRESPSGRRFGLALAALAAILVVGTIGFRLILDEGWVAALYRTVVTISLTGLDDKPSGTGGEIFTMFVIFAGVAIFAYAAGVLVETIAREFLGGGWGKRRRRRTIEELRDHYIVCGYGRVGRRVSAELREAAVAYVVLDNTPTSLEEAREHDELLIEGDSTDDEDLRRAGLPRARGLIAAADSDVVNLYVTLSARAAQPNLLIVARASTEDAAAKLRRAGADRVVQPYSTAGHEMAQLILRPQVAAFLDALSAEGGLNLGFEEIEVSAACGQAGNTIGELRIRGDTGATIVAIRKADGSYGDHPAAETVLEEGDVLIVVGTPEQTRAAEKLFAARETLAR